VPSGRLLLAGALLATAACAGGVKNRDPAAGPSTAPSPPAADAPAAARPAAAVSDVRRVEYFQISDG
jgi:hypothetical protein